MTARRFLTAIVADDEPLLRMVIAESLEEHGFTVIEAADGIEALELSLRHPESCLIISDVRMPQMDGYTLAEKVLSLPQPPAMLLMTGYADKMPEAIRERVEVLRKPVDMAALCKKAIEKCPAQ